MAGTSSSAYRPMDARVQQSSARPTGALEPEHVNPQARVSTAGGERSRGQARPDPIADNAA